MKARKLTLTQRVANLERANRKLRAECKWAASTAECAFEHARRLAEHVERLLAEKQTLMRLSDVPVSLRRGDA